MPRVLTAEVMERVSQDITRLLKLDSRTREELQDTQFAPDSKALLYYIFNVLKDRSMFRCHVLAYIANGMKLDPEVYAGDNLALLKTEILQEIKEEEKKENQYDMILWTIAAMVRIELSKPSKSQDFTDRQAA